MFRITGKQFEVTEAIKSYAEQKTGKLPRYYNTIYKIDVVIDGAGTNGSVEIIASGEHNKVFVAKERGADPYACIDLAVDKLETQLSRTKAKERDNKHRI